MIGISNIGGAAMHVWETIEQSLTFIEEHLAEEIFDGGAGKYGRSVLILFSALVQAAGK